MVAQLQSITATDLGNFLSTVFSDLDLATAVDVGMPVWMALPTSSDQARANALGRAFLADILAVMADLTGDRRPTPLPPFLIVLDEFGSYALAEFAEMLRKAREANIQVVVSLTTIADLQDPARGLTSSFPDQLLGNAEAIYMGSWAPGTLRYAEDYYGEEKQLIASRRESLAQNVLGRLASAEDRYWNPQLGTARTVFDQLTEKREPRLRKELLNELRQHEAVVFFQGHPTLVHLVYYFAPVTEQDKDPATVVPTWLRAPLQPAGLSEYVLAHHMQLFKTTAVTGMSPEPATPPARETPARAAKPARKRTRRKLDPTPP
jgi:hypothetical protein